MPILLTPLAKIHIESLVDFLNNDKRLRQSLGIHKTTNEEGFSATLALWKKKHHGETYAIVLKDQPIGTISISEVPGSPHAVKIGYWITSTQWNKQYGTQALRSALKIAKEAGAKQATATIQKNSAASYKMWQHIGATFKENIEGFHARVDII